jgi:hypothetical protein
MSDDPVDPYKIKVYEVFRDQIFGEDRSINRRVYVTIITQIAFISLWMYVTVNPDIYPQGNIPLFLAIAQAIAALLAFIAIVSGFLEIRQSKRRYRKNFASAADALLTPVIVTPSRVHTLSHVVAVATPVVFLLLSLFFVYRSL